MDGVGAVAIVTLELSRGTQEVSAGVRLILPVSTVILAVTLPPEWNAFQLLAAQKVSWLGAVGITCYTIICKYKVFRTAADFIKNSIIVSKKTESMAATIIFTWIGLVLLKSWLT